MSTPQRLVKRDKIIRGRRPAKKGEARKYQSMKINRITWTSSACFPTVVTAGTRRKRSSGAPQQAIPSQHSLLPLRTRPPEPTPTLHAPIPPAFHLGWSRVGELGFWGILVLRCRARHHRWRSGRGRQIERGHPWPGWICRLIDYISSINYSYLRQERNKEGQIHHQNPSMNLQTTKYNPFDSSLCSQTSLSSNFQEEQAYHLMNHDESPQKNDIKCICSRYRLFFLYEIVKKRIIVLPYNSRCPLSMTFIIMPQRNIKLQGKQSLGTILRSCNELSKVHIRLPRLTDSLPRNPESSATMGESTGLRDFRPLKMKKFRLLHSINLDFSISNTPTSHLRARTETFTRQVNISPQNRSAFMQIIQKYKRHFNPSNASKGISSTSDQVRPKTPRKLRQLRLSTDGREDQVEMKRMEILHQVIAENNRREMRVRRDKSKTKQREVQGMLGF